MTLNGASHISLSSPVVVGVPCFSGAPWDLERLAPLAERHETRTMRLPEGLNDIDAYADYVAKQVADLDFYVLAGDSYGAVISLMLATRRPQGLAGLVLSGGFAANPLPIWKGIAAAGSRFAGGPLYRQGTLRFHAYQLASRYDADAEVPLTQRDYRRLFTENTPRSSYTARVTSVTHFDVRERLSQVEVPTLIITPADDRLVGPEAAADLLHGLPHAREVVLPGTGHMFRFTHPTLYSRTIADFLEHALRTAAEGGAQEHLLRTAGTRPGE